MFFVFLHWLVELDMFDDSDWPWTRYGLGYFPAGYVDLEDFILCKNESGGDPGACLKEGRRITRCATDL